MERQPVLILDVRDSASFERLHRLGAVNIPFEELPRRIHELPPRDHPLTIYDADPNRARELATHLQGRGRTAVQWAAGSDWLQAGRTATGPNRDRFWEAHPLLIEAVGLAKSAWGGVHGRRALDIACGTGRDAVQLALDGFDVEAWDILPDALERCTDLARRNRVRVATHCRNVEADPTIPGGPFAFVCSFNFLHRPLMARIAEAVTPGGFVAYETFVDPQIEAFGKPSRQAHVLHRGELPTYFPGWNILISREALAGPTRHAASLIVRKP